MFIPYLGDSSAQFNFALLLPQDRIEVVEANIAHRPDIILAADVIIMNNVFEFFMEPEQQISVWRFLRQTIKSGTLLVTVPPLEETFSCLQISINL
jgi:chemotaxis methyl-accepting protein methylase